MSAPKRSQLPAEPPPAVMAAVRSRLSEREQQMFGTIFAIRSTAQQMDNTVCEWMADSAATPARFQILVQLWAAKGHGVAQKDIAAAMGVTRATVSGLISALERDGLVTSAVADNDRRSQLASLTRKGETVVEKAMDTNKALMRKVFTALSADELATLTTLLARVRNGFTADGAGKRDRKP
ncbi:MAG TPA: MarR family winged helix-turn-helix transcriptional regulator [Rhizomicrobium sp.]